MHLELFLVGHLTACIVFRIAFTIFILIIMEGESSLSQHCPCKKKRKKRHLWNQVQDYLLFMQHWLLKRPICCFVLYSVSDPQRQEGHTQRFIREVNTTSRSCVLWDLEEETDYIIQVQSIGLYGESQASKKVHFRTLKKSDRFPSNSSNQGEPPRRADGISVCRDVTESLICFCN